MNCMKRIFLLSICLTWFVAAVAQDEPKNDWGQKNSIEFAPQMSLALFTAQQKVSGTAWGGELVYHRNTQNNPMPWIRILNVTSVDLVFNYKNMTRVKLLDSPDDPYKLGSSYAFLAGVNMALYKKAGLEIDLSPSFGLGFLDETYFTNKNPLIGSHINFASRAALKVYQNISSATKVMAGIDILHFSNAGARVPNNGMNSANLNLGIVRALAPVRDKPADTALRSWASRHRYKTHSFDIGIGIGRRGYYRSKEGFFYKTSLYGGYNYRLNPVFGLSTGLDAIYYHGNLFDLQDFDKTYQSNASSFDRWRIGAAIGPDIWMNRIALTVKYGYYLKYNSYRDISTYWTSGLKYNLLDWLAAQARIHVHKTEADFAAFGLMFTL